MQRIMIIGSAGSGKSTFAKLLGKITSLPVYHLDVLFWNPGWIETSRPLFDKKQQEVVMKERWIIDGNYSRTMDIRLPRADTIFYLNFPRFICLWRAIKRSLLYRNKNRSDITKGCYERFDLEFIKFLKWIWDYPKRSRGKTIEKLHALKNKKKIAIFYSPNQVNSFFKHFERIMNRNKSLQ